jgi:glycosyltransferase involved in cell wall biosynthesis
LTLESASPRLKVLITAFACEPHRGSEPGVGWNWALQAARDHNVWVITRELYRKVISQEMASAPEELKHNLHFVYYDIPIWMRRLCINERIWFTLWEIGLLARARELHREVGFDLTHHLNFVTVEMPGLLWKLDTPFVWGPVGGGQVPPPVLKQYYGGFWAAEMVRAMRKRLLAFNPFVRGATKHAASIIVSNRETQRLVEPMTKTHLTSATEIGISIPAPRPERESSGRLEIAWAGVLTPRKGPLLALDVAAELKKRDVNFRLRFAGVGPWQERLELRIRELELQDCVEVLGAVPFDEMSAYYFASDVFLFTSLQDTTGTVVAEAMSHGLPIVTLDHQGAALMVTDQCGVKIKIESPRQVVEDMAKALQVLSLHADWRQSLGTAARRRAEEHYTWHNKADLLRETYARAVTSAQASQPARRPTAVRA